MSSNSLGQVSRGLLLGLIMLTNARASDFSGLIENNPFGKPAKVQEKPPERPPQFELRGVIREREGYLLNIYDIAAGKSVWARAGDQVADFRLKGYDQSAGTALLEMGEQSLSLALRAPMYRTRGPAGPILGAPVFVAESLRITEVTLAAAAPPESEVKRMESVAQQIRFRRERRNAANTDARL